MFFFLLRDHYLLNNTKIASPFIRINPTRNINSVCTNIHFVNDEIILHKKMAFDKRHTCKRVYNQIGYFIFQEKRIIKRALIIFNTVFSPNTSDKKIYSPNTPVFFKPDTPNFFKNSPDTLTINGRQCPVSLYLQIFHKST